MNEAKKECEVLLGIVLPLARRLLAEQGEFFPFGTFMRPDGSVVDVGAQLDGSDRPPSSALIENT